MKYFQIAKIAALQVLAARGEAVARMLFYLALLLVFSQLWEAVDESGKLAGVTSTSMLWYLALTEWITVGMPMLYIDIQEDVRRGDVAYKIARPVSYLGTKLAEGAGELVVRLALLGVAGVLAAWILGKGFPADPRGLWLALPVGLLASCVLLLFQAAIGLSSFWVQDAQPVFWIWQKLAFVFGGLIIPLDIYPDWLRTIAEWTPFAPVLYGLGRLALEFDPVQALWTCAQIVIWGVLLVGVVSWMYKRALGALTVNGG